MSDGMKATGSMTPLETTAAMYGCVGRGDWDGVASLLAEEFVIHEPPSLPYGGEWRGRDALRRLHAEVMGFWDDPHVEPDGLVGDAHHTVALLRMTLTARPTGRRFTTHIAEVAQFDAAGLMTSIRVHYFDTAELLRQLAP